MAKYPKSNTAPAAAADINPDEFEAAPPVSEQSPPPDDTKGDPAPTNSGTVKFATRRPGLQVLLGNKKVVFDGRDVTVDAETAERLKNHFLFAQGHIMLADDTRMVNGELVEVSAGAKEILASRAPGEVIFNFSEAPNGTITLIPGRLVVQFSHGYAKVNEETAAMLRLHTFSVQGRLQEVQ